jgi:hypothetical protein
MTARYNPPTKVRTLQMPFTVLVHRADPDFEQMRRKEPFYEFTGRKFEENTATQGPYSTVPNIR